MINKLFLINFFYRWTFFNSKSSTYSFYKRIVFTALFFFEPKLFTQNVKQDSLAIVNSFNHVVSNPQLRDSTFAEIDKIVKRNQKNLLIQDTYYFHYSRYFFINANLDSALLYANKGLSLYNFNPLNIKKSKFHNLKGSVLSLKKNYTEGIAEFQKSIEILEYNSDFKSVAYIKNNIANIFFSLRDYESSYQYSLASYLQLKKENDSIYLPSVTGILAISEIKLGKIKEGEKHTIECLEMSEKHTNNIGLIVGYYSEGELFVVKDEFENARNSFLKSLHLSQQYEQKHYVLLNKISLLFVHNKLNDFKNSVIYGEEALTESNEQQNENTLYAIYKNLGYAYYGLGEYKKAYQNINQAHNLFCSISDEKNKEIINDILIKYETEKKEKKIIENELKISKNERKISQRNAFIFLLLSIIISLLFLYFLYNRYQKQRLLEIEKDQENKIFIASITGEERERERISNEIHDGLASKITGVKLQIENLADCNDDIELKKISQQLSLLHEETRRVSHNLMPLQLDKFSLSEAIHQYCIENSSRNLKIEFRKFESESFKLNLILSKVLYRIVQELINNVQKHSKSKICYVQVIQQNKKLQISVEDEGIGFDCEINSGHQGIESIKKRIADLNGDFVIESEKDKGTLAMIEIKIN